MDFLTSDYPSPPPLTPFYPSTPLMNTSHSSSSSNPEPKASQNTHSWYHQPHPESQAEYARA